MAPDERKPPVPSVPEEQLMRELREWEAQQVKPVTLFDVVRSNDINLTAAFILRGFRSAANAALREKDRVFRLRNLAFAAFGDPQAALDFLEARHPALGCTPLQAAASSPDGMVDAIKALPDYVRAIGTHCLAVVARAWTLTEEEQAQLLSCSATELARWKRLPWRLPNEAFEKIALLLAITKALSILLPSDAARTWVKRPNNAALFRDLTALELMIRDGESGMRLVRDYLEAEIWST